jgi:hypothetical protein
MKIFKDMAFIWCALLVTAMGCKNHFSKEDELKLYNTVVDQIIYDNYYQSCLANDNKLHQDFLSGKIPEPAYLKIVDSLKAIRKMHGPKCKVDYTDRLGVLTKDSVFDNDIKLYIIDNLKDTFFVSHFGNASNDDVLDKLSKPANLNLSDLQINYMDMVPHDNSTPYGNGIGLIAISKIYFNEKFNKAILYYEFLCGPLCGKGEVVFIDKVSNGWKVVGYGRVFDI